MCNRVVQKGRGEVRPGQLARVLLKGPGAVFEIEAEGVFSGCARVERKEYWIRREGAEPVLVPEVERFGEKHQITGQQSYEDVPPGTALEGLLLPPRRRRTGQVGAGKWASQPPGKDYRLLKIVTQDATPEEFARWGNDRAPVVMRSHPVSTRVNSPRNDDALIDEVAADCLLPTRPRPGSESVQPDLSG